MQMLHVVAVGCHGDSRRANSVASGQPNEHVRDCKHVVQAATSHQVRFLVFFFYFSFFAIFNNSNNNKKDAISWVLAKVKTKRQVQHLS